MGETYITCREENGSINISEDVISGMVRTAVTEVEGDRIVVGAIITVHYGSKIMEVARNVQEKVMNVIQSTTGLEKAEVNVHVSGIAFEK